MLLGSEATCHAHKRGSPEFRLAKPSREDGEIHSENREDGDDHHVRPVDGEERLGSEAVRCRRGPGVRSCRSATGDGQTATRSRDRMHDTEGSIRSAPTAALGDDFLSSCVAASSSCSPSDVSSSLIDRLRRFSSCSLPLSADDGNAKAFNKRMAPPARSATNFHGCPEKTVRPRRSGRT